MVRVGIEMWAWECLLGSCTKARRSLISAVSVIQDRECFLGGLTKGRTQVHALLQSQGVSCGLRIAGQLLEYGQANLRVRESLSSVGQHHEHAPDPS